MGTCGPTRRARLALITAKCALVGVTVLVVALSAFGRSPAVPDPGRPGAAGATAGLIADASPTVQRAMARHECTETGFGARATPRSALIVRSGVLEHVSFDQGWSVFIGERPGLLLGVCLSET